MNVHKLLAPAALLLATAGLALSSLPVLDGPAPGDVAPEIDGERWYNHLGQSPTLASFTGQPVLIEFWATW